MSLAVDRQTGRPVTGGLHGWLFLFLGLFQALEFTVAKDESNVQICRLSELPLNHVTRAFYELHSRRSAQKIESKEEPHAAASVPRCEDSLTLGDRSQQTPTGEL